MAEINLVPGTQYIMAARRRRRNLYLLSVAIVVVAFVLTGALYFLKQNAAGQLKAATDELNSVNLEIARLGDGASRVDMFEKRLSAMNQLLDSHISWNKVFTDLEKVLPPTTVIYSLKAEVGNKTIEFSGITPTIDAVAQTFASLLSTPSHGTVFTGGQITNVAEKNITDAANQVVGKTYTFAGRLFINDASLTRQVAK